MNLIFKNQHKNKHFIWQQILTPFVMLLDSLINIALLALPYQCDLSNIWLRHIIKKQCAKRIKQSR